ncbi:hypothetical protein OkiPb00161_48690 [Escherichia coli]
MQSGTDKGQAGPRRQIHREGTDTGHHTGERGTDGPFVIGHYPTEFTNFTGIQGRIQRCAFLYKSSAGRRQVSRELCGWRGTACRGVPGCLSCLSASLWGSCVLPARVICSRDSAAHNKQCAKKMMYLHDMSLRFLMRRYGKPSG